MIKCLIDKLQSSLWHFGNQIIQEHLVLDETCSSAIVHLKDHSQLT